MLGSRVCFEGYEVFVFMVPHEDTRISGEDWSWIAVPACQWSVMRFGRLVCHGNKYIHVSRE
jgi:hypothetical protein